MKLTKTQLKQIIREELNKELTENVFDAMGPIKGRLKGVGGAAQAAARGAEKAFSGFDGSFGLDQYEQGAEEFGQEAAEEAGFTSADGRSMPGDDPRDMSHEKPSRYEGMSTKWLEKRGWEWVPDSATFVHKKTGKELRTHLDKWKSPASRKARAAKRRAASPERIAAQAQDVFKKGIKNLPMGM